jgi:hypothetical protein
MIAYILISIFCIIVGLKLAVNETPDKHHKEKNH